MDHEDIKKGQVSRRDFLGIMTGGVGGAGVCAAAYPFLRGMSPTKDLIASGVMEIDIGDIKEGEMKTVIWRKQPLLIVRRTTEMIEKAKQIDPAGLRDPATEADRVQRPDLLVVIGICTHLGCIPKFRPKAVEGTDQPGFYCPCHAGKYDSLGRQIDGPPPENLHLVPYTIVGDTKLIVGTETFAGYGANIRKIQDLPKQDV